MAPTGALEQRHGAIAILNVGRVHEEFERPSVGIDHGMAFTAHHLLSRIVAAGPACFGCLHALTVDHRCRRGWLPADPHPVELYQMMVEPLERGGVAQFIEPSIHRTPRRKLSGRKRQGHPARST
jgi:hypothetical protein